MAPTTVAKRAVAPGDESNRTPAVARWTRCGRELAEKEFRSLSVDRERWQRPLDQHLRRWMEFPGNRDRDPWWWRKESRRHGRERRPVPGPSRLVATRLGSLSRWLVSQDSKETDLCGRKNKHQPCRLPSAARLPWLQRLRPAGPNPTRVRSRATSRRTGKPRNSCWARILPRLRAERVAGRSDRALRCSNVPFGL